MPGAGDPKALRLPGFPLGPANVKKKSSTMKQMPILLALLMVLPGLGWTQSIRELNVATVKDLDQITEFHEGLAAVRKGNSWGFIDAAGTLVIGFRDDLVWNESPDPGANGVEGIAYPRFSEGRCPFRAFREEEGDIPFYGFIDTKGQPAIEAEFLNVTEFRDGVALGVYFKKTFRGKNNFQLNIYDYAFTEVVLNPAGEMIWPLAERQNIIMQPRRYKAPDLLARILGTELVAVEATPGNWEIRHIKPQTVN